MAELAGLLDRARTKMRGLLGDFPEGFNAGAVAGMGGWLGDIAYGIDTARLALTGADAQAPAQDFPGTTDYIAARAGHPIPQTLSGQLGAAIGGFLTPGPGDLARLAPLGAMFLGARAKSANKGLLDLAMAMDAGGASRDEIWRVTAQMGQPWFKGADGKWRFEVSDKGTYLDDTYMDFDSQGFFSGNVGDSVKTPWGVQENYPELAGQEFAVSPWAAPSTGNYNNGIYIGMDPHQREGWEEGYRNLWNYKNDDDTKISLHELMHGVQQQEGFAVGANPEVVGWRDYIHSAGENEAYNVTDRADMDMAERIKFPPWTTQKYPYEQQIVRFGGGGAAAMPALSYKPIINDLRKGEGWKTVDDAFEVLTDDRSSGDEILATAAREIYPGMDKSKRMNLDFFLEEVIRRADEMAVEDW